MIIKRSQILRDQELLKFQSYEDYLDSFITSRDLYHLRSKALSRRIIELGYHTEGTLERDAFYDSVKAIKRQLFLLENPYALCSEAIKPKDALLKELALREKENRDGKLYTIIFIRYCGKSQSQISAFIDYNHRLKSEDWKPYFEKTKKLLPKKSDLSYYDWKSGKSILNESLNFTPIIDGKNGLVFQNNHNSKFIFIDVSLTPESDLSRVSIYSEIYGHVVLYDHKIQNEIITDD